MKSAQLALRIILVVVGAVVIFVSANVAFGGLYTLGWQGSDDFFAVTNEATFAVRDNHTRFYGGVFLALGLFLVVAAVDPQRFRGGLLLAFVLMFAGGLARLSQLQPEVTFGPGILISTLVELVLMPVLFAWVWRTPARSVHTEHDATP